jgi:hypothetical protein
MNDDTFTRLRIVLRDYKTIPTDPIVVTEERFIAAAYDLLKAKESGDTRLKGFFLRVGYLRPDSSGLADHAAWLRFRLPVYVFGFENEVERTIAKQTWEGPLVSNNVAYHVPSHLFAVITPVSRDHLHVRANGESEK